MTTDIKKKLESTGVDAIDGVISQLQNDEKIIQEHKANIAGLASIREDIEKLKKE
jgi:hypothetical protein